MEEDQTLVVGYQGATAALDTTRRAWVLVVGRLVDLEPRGPFSEAQMTQLIDAATQTGEFPCGPLAYAPEHEETEFNPDYRMITVRARHNGEPYLESKTAFGIAGFVARSFTRSGRLEPNGEVYPSHVLLIDFEAVLAETMILLERAAAMFEYVGPTRLMAGVVSNVPGHRLQLRCLDEETGAVGPPGPPVDLFQPVVFDFAAGATREEAHRQVYDALVEVAPRFGVDQPQFFYDPYPDAHKYFE